MAALTERFHGLRRPGASLLKKGLPSRPDEPVLARKAVPPPKVIVDQPATITITTSPTGPASSTSTPILPVGTTSPPAQLKNLPSLPRSPAPAYPPPNSSLPPTPSGSSVSSPASPSTVIAATPSPSVPQSQSQSQPQPQSQSQPQTQPQSQYQSQPINQAVRPPRTTSLASPQNNGYPDRRPQHRQVQNLQVNHQRPGPGHGPGYGPGPQQQHQQQQYQQRRPISEAPSISQFIPEPEPEPELPDAEQEPDLIPDEQGRSSESENSSEQISLRNSNGVPSPNFKNFPDGYVPPLPEPLVIPPLTDVHYGCYQSHIAMPAASNVWYATGCMTCKKIDQEMRHRCTFCCMRICSGCYESLKKCKNRSLTELMATL